MSTLAYAALTSRRDEEPPGTTSTGAPGVKTYVDALAALVPAEVLAAHAAIVLFATETTTDATGNSIVQVTEEEVLKVTFWALLIISAGLYVAWRWVNKKLDRLDLIRSLIPPFAFTLWVMAQKASAFDAVWPSLGDAERGAYAVLGALVLGFVAAALAYRADQKTKPAG